MWHCRRSIAVRGSFVKQNQELFSLGTKAWVCCTGNPSIWHPGSVVLNNCLVRAASCHFELVPMCCTVIMCMFTFVCVSCFGSALPLQHIHHNIVEKWLCQPLDAVTGCRGNLGHNACTKPKQSLSRAKKTRCPNKKTFIPRGNMSMFHNIWDYCTTQHPQHLMVNWKNNFCLFSCHTF